MLDSGHTDRLGRRVTLRPAGDDNWRAVADTAAARLYTSLGFAPTGVVEDDELVAELRR
ncbi:hypothetical protein [Micromonospora sp. WMMD714]|uniref:hypothetical protein n=1 Tax=Micromonospora sp. WMMD714 TaxID=3016097 RepID=UPI00249AF20E|nr:hypothetical protein [Micromonospora sp. WMMD714]WFE64537.1 hypothetical protein O7625_15185 [Micromonospora sp. WMMD714]